MTKIFDIWHPISEHPTQDGDEDYSDDVIIDLDGYRETFRVGWYDFENQAWRLHDLDSAVEEDNAKWSYLPLNKYDK